VQKGQSISAFHLRRGTFYFGERITSIAVRGAMRGEWPEGTGGEIAPVSHAPRNGS